MLVAPNQDLVDSTVGHVLVSDTLAHFTNTANLLKGWSGETAGRRIERLCTEEGISLVSVGDLDTTAAVGVQLPVPLMELFTESGDADLGIVTDARASAAILYRTRESLYGQTAALALDYAAAEVAPPLEPVVDDQATRNDVTVSRENGGSYRTSLDTGPLSTQAPPDGVGRYNTSVTVNVADDAQLPDQAGWRLHLGTTRETRYPQVTVDLDASPHLAAAVSAIDIGDRLTIANLPATISPDLASLIVQGYTETIGSHRRVVTFNTTPEQPWVVGVYGATGVTPDPDAPERYSPPEGTETQLVEFVSGTDTVLKSTTTSAGTWSTTADFPYDIDVAGVRLRVTAVSAVLGANQNLTVEQTPINGVTKTIPTGTPIRLWQPAVYAL